jgi:hypothetical protein
LRRPTWLLKNRTDLDVPKSHSAIAYVTDVTGRSDVVLNLKEKKKPFSFFRLVEGGG